MPDLAALLHRIWAEEYGSEGPATLETIAARLRAAGVTLAAAPSDPAAPPLCGARHPKHPTTCRQPSGHDGDHATARRDVVWAAPSDPAAPLRKALEVISEGRHPDGHRGAVLVARAALATPAAKDTDRDV